MAADSTIIVLLLILSVGLVIPELFKRLRMPFVTSLIVIGAILGPYGLGYVVSNEVIEFFGFLGSAFLLLMAGLESKADRLAGEGGHIMWMAALNALIPFVTGMVVTRLLGYPWMSALMIGTIFISSSIAIVVASVHGARLHNTRIGRAIISATMMEDIASLLMLAIVLQSVAPITDFPLPIYFIVLIMSVLVLKLFLPEIAKYFFSSRRKDTHEGQLRFVIVVLMAVLLYFNGLGVHPYVAAFVVGLLLSDVVTSDVVYSKMHTIGYGLFVPVFFFIVGSELRVDLLWSANHADVVIAVIIVSLIGAKLVSGYLGGLVAGFSSKHALTFGIASMPQLTTTLAATFAATSLGIIDSILATAVIVLSIVTTILSPLLLSLVRRISYD